MRTLACQRPRKTMTMMTGVIPLPILPIDGLLPRACLWLLSHFPYRLHHLQAPLPRISSILRILFQKDSQHILYIVARHLSQPHPPRNRHPRISVEGLCIFLLRSRQPPHSKNEVRHNNKLRRIIHHPPFIPLLRPSLQHPQPPSDKQPSA